MKWGNFKKRKWIIESHIWVQYHWEIDEVWCFSKKERDQMLSRNPRNRVIRVEKYK